MARGRGIAAARQKTAVEAALAICPNKTLQVSCALEGRKMQPNSVAPLPVHSEESLEESQGKSVRQVLADLLGERQFDLWFRKKTRLAVKSDELVVYAASPFLQKWLQKQHRVPLTRAAQTVLGASARVRFDVDTLPPPAAAAGCALENTEAQGKATRAVPVVSGGRPARPAEASEPSAVVPLRQGRRFADLCDFIRGPCNEMALTAARQLCERPEGASGPLFVYGPVGMGKTHLLEGLYRELRRRHPAKQVIYLTSEQFTNHFTQAFRDRTMPAFRQRFRTVDVLLVDDIDFLDAKRGVQEEFLHTCQQLESHGRLLVACGDRHPRLLTKISDELKTRFLSGMVCRLEPPDLETRERIVVAKAHRLEAEISPEALKYVARRFTSSIRELEGALSCLQLYHRMTGKRVGTSAAREVLGDLERDCLRIVRMADIERAVCDLFGVEAAALKSTRRSRSVSEPRMLAMYLARRHTRAAYSEIGEYFGGRNHATVISADRKVSEWLARDAQVQVASQQWRLADVLSTLEQQMLAG
jgi:chromosomal replication initiator protein